MRNVTVTSSVVVTSPRHTQSESPSQPVGSMSGVEMRSR